MGRALDASTGKKAAQFAVLAGIGPKTGSAPGGIGTSDLLHGDDVGDARPFEDMAPPAVASKHAQFDTVSLTRSV